MKVPEELQVPFVVVRVDPVVQEPVTIGAVVLATVNPGTIAVEVEFDVYLYAVEDTVLLPNTCALM